ncbi:uncharacterized protein DS421_17g585200 [Arachis hypogaea]|nr:uncharacterized protein DS421_17g585200 [Arachis hypogaea]
MPISEYAKSKKKGKGSEGTPTWELLQIIFQKKIRRRRGVPAACSVVKVCEEEEARQGKKRKKEEERGFSKMTAYVEPRQEEEEPWSSARGGEHRADARGGEQRADALGGEQRANAVEGSTAPSPFGGGQHCDRELRSSWRRAAIVEGLWTPFGVGFKC